jgi:hypothetical protein
MLISNFSTLCAFIVCAVIAINTPFAGPVTNTYVGPVNGPYLEHAGGPVNSPYLGPVGIAGNIPEYVIFGFF